MKTRQATLKQPIIRGEGDEKKEVYVVELREPKAGSLRGLNNFDVLQANVTAHRTLIPRISNITANEIDEMSPDDLLSVQQEVIAFFLPATVEL